MISILLNCASPKDISGTGVSPVPGTGWKPVPPKLKSLAFKSVSPPTENRKQETENYLLILKVESPGKFI
jgi:hypothetical protein